MRISSKARYATIALMDIASQENQAPVTLADISRRQDISVSYLEQIFARLRRGGIVIASRGPGGGYKLSRPADQVSLADIADIFSKEPATAPEAGDNPAMAAWLDFSADMQQFLKDVTLAKYLRDKSTSMLGAA